MRAFVVMVAVLSLATSVFAAGSAVKPEIKSSVSPLSQVVGPAVIVLYASVGNVTFSHKMHQDMIKDCRQCHHEPPGKIAEIGKYWAHNTCQTCHEILKRAGRRTGPTNCVGCHKL